MHIILIYFIRALIGLFLLFCAYGLICTIMIAIFGWHNHRHNK